MSWIFSKNVETLVLLPFCAFGLFTTPYWALIWVLSFPIIYITMLMIQLCAVVILIASSKLISSNEIQNFFEQCDEYSLSRLNMINNDIPIKSETLNTMKLHQNDWNFNKPFCE